MNVMLTDDYVLVNGSKTDVININDNNSYNNNININNDNDNKNKEDEPLLSHSHGTVQVSAKVAVWNLYADVLGPGAVALPFYITQSGLGAGCLLILVMAFLSSVTLDDIHLMYTRLGKKNYPDLCRAVLGRPGYFVVCFAIFCFNFGGLCGQLMLFGTVVPDIMMDLFGVHPLFNKTYLILLACVIFLPISLLKDIAKFSFVSLISVSCIFVLAGLLFFRLMFKKVGDFDIPGQGGDHGDTNPYAFVHYSVFSSLGGLAYVFVCHDLSFNVIGSLKNPTAKRYRGVVAATMIGTIATCSLIGFSGYLLFFHEVKANIFENFPRKDAVATIGRCILAICITLAIPFTCFMPRVSIIAVISSMGEGAKKWAHSNFGHFIETIMVLGSAVGIAIVVNNLGDVFELVGGVSACTLAFLLPPILIFKSIGYSHLSFIKVVITVLVFIAGLVILVGTLVDVFLFPSS